MEMHIEVGETAAWEFAPNTEVQLENRLPATAEVLVTMVDGSFIRFPLAMRAQATLKSKGAIAGVKMALPESEGFGPRRVD